MNIWNKVLKVNVSALICNLQSYVKMSTLEHLKFDNLALSTLPLDKSLLNTTRTVRNACFSLVDPTPVDQPELVAYSRSALNLLDISSHDINENFLDYFCGNKKIPGSETAAHCYCGHQFGYFSGQLGDGAAVYLGEIINSSGERWELQLKGAGKTPYSRHADGRKVLRSSIREFLCSEAMHHLGVPTTRAATCITSDSRVMRDIFYDGRPKMEKCTIVSRIAPTFLRFGSFEIFKEKDPQTFHSGSSVGRTDILHTLLQYTIKTFFPAISPLLESDQEECYLQFYKEVVIRTANLVASWQCVGFCHGVLNTDNMSIIGVTIDYGPFGFMDYFDPDYICNASAYIFFKEPCNHVISLDTNGRYSYANQPKTCKWNLMKLSESLQSVLPMEKSKAALEEIYDKQFSSQFHDKMRKKLGLVFQEDSNDEELIRNLFFTMQETSADFTNTFRLLSSFEPLSDSRQLSKMKAIVQLSAVYPSLLQQVGVTLEELQEKIEQHEKIKKRVNMTQEEKHAKDRKLWNKWLLEYSSRLKKEHENHQCDDVTQFMQNRRTTMRSVNPSIVLRNHLAQEAITAAENGNFSKVTELLTQLENPYDNEDQTKEYFNCSNDRGSVDGAFASKYMHIVPEWAIDIKVT